MQNLFTQGIEVVEGSLAVDDAMGTCRAWMESKITVNAVVGLTRIAPPGAVIEMKKIDGEYVGVPVSGQNYLTLTSSGLHQPDTGENMVGVDSIEAACDAFLLNFVCYAWFATFFRTHKEPEMTLHWRIYPQLLTGDGLFSVRCRLLIA